jgi:hypothetical protein
MGPPGEIVQDFEDEAENGQDRRGYSRLRCQGAAEMRVLPNGAVEKGRVINLSRRGCCFLADRVVATESGRIVELHMKVRGTDFRVVGGIRYTQEQKRAGIEFVALSERNGELIEELVAELSALHTPAR